MAETLDQIGIRTRADKASFAHGYTKYYETLFGPLRDEPIRLLEIGVQFGASIKMWLEYFSRAHIFGVDVVSSFVCSDPRYTFILADQGNAAEMTKIAKAHGSLDVVIDDGCHRAGHVKVSLECLWPVVKSRGLYIVEDCFAAWCDHPYFTTTIDGPAFFRSFVDDVNLRGKDFPGRPYPWPGPMNLTVMEATLESVMYTKGLTILRKK